MQLQIQDVNLKKTRDRGAADKAAIKRVKDPPRQLPDSGM